MRTERTLVRRAVLAVAMLALAGWFVFLRPQALGGPAAYITVAGTSMEPALHAGDLVVVTRAERYEPGDVVAYRVPEPDPAAGRHVIHRVLGTSGDGYVLQGDNTDDVDRWLPTDEDVIGRQVFVVPDAGSALMLLQSPAVLAGLSAALLVYVLPLWEPSASRPAARSRRPDPGWAFEPARIVKLNETVMPVGMGAPGYGAQVLVEFRNEGGGWAEISVDDSRFWLIGDDGSVIASGAFSAASPAHVAPGGIGYMLGDVAASSIAPSERNAVRSAIAYRDGRQWSSPAGGRQSLRVAPRAPSSA